MSKHTPGPWTLCHAEQSGIAVAHAEHGEFKQPRAALAIVGSHPTNDCDFHYIVAMNSHVQAQADARLIAAAPDLLEALKLARSIIGHPDDAHSQMIDAAIAKAEGA